MYMRFARLVISMKDCPTLKLVILAVPDATIFQYVVAQLLRNPCGKPFSIASAGATDADRPAARYPIEQCFGKPKQYRTSVAR